MRCCVNTQIHLTYVYFSQKHNYHHCNLVTNRQRWLHILHINKLKKNCLLMQWMTANKNTSFNFEISVNRFSDSTSAIISMCFCCEKKTFPLTYTVIRDTVLRLPKFTLCLTHKHTDTHMHKTHQMYATIIDCTKAVYAFLRY